MAAHKVSLTLDQNVVVSARDRAGRRGLSSYVNEAVRLQLQQDRLADLLAEHEQQHGPIPSEIMEQVREDWPDPATQARRRSA